MFHVPNRKKLLQCVISLFEDKIRLLTGQDEVTNSLVDRVADHIHESLMLHFAMEQLGLTWKEVSVMSKENFSFADIRQQVRCEGITERNITRNDRKNILKIREWALL